MDKIRVWLRWFTVRKALEAFLVAGDHEHQRARDTTGEESKQHRAEAEDFYAAKKDLWDSIHKVDPPSMKNCSDESVHGNTAPVQITRFSLPKDARNIFVATAFALSIAVNIWCGWTIRDIGTRKWLHDYDLNQFQMGEFRNLQREVDLDHALLQQQCRRP